MMRGVNQKLRKQNDEFMTEKTKQLNEDSTLSKIFKECVYSLTFEKGLKTPDQLI